MAHCSSQDSQSSSILVDLLLETLAFKSAHNVLSGWKSEIAGITPNTRNQYKIWYQVAKANRNISWQLQLYANIQSATANLSSCWITTTTTGCKSQISSNLFHGKH